MKYLLVIGITTCFLSCKKEEYSVQTREEIFDASYTVRIRLNWQGPAFAVPPMAHVTPLMGMVHSKAVRLWNQGSQATKGLEDLAELGNNTAINLELDAFIAGKNALAKFMLPAPNITGGFDTVLTFNKNFSCISFASMLAPSPDWFLGLNSIDLVTNNNWIKDTTVNLMLCDAGTEDGDIFGYDNPATDPQQNIVALTPANAMSLANGNAAINVLGTVQFVKN